MLSVVLFILCKSPTKAVLLSLFLPAGGQFYVGNHFKGILMGSLDVYLTYNLAVSYIDFSKTNPSKFDYKTKAQNFFGNLTLWLIFKLFSMNDAYVSAYFYNFDKQVKEVSIEIKVRKK